MRVSIQHGQILPTQSGLDRAGVDALDREQRRGSVAEIMKAMMPDTRA